MPIGRYLEYLVSTNNYQDYISELCSSYNPRAVENIMCKTTISVGWDGTLYDCDFNQILSLPIKCDEKANIKNFNLSELKNREIIFKNHCYGCVAGLGSSCQGETS